MSEPMKTADQTASMPIANKAPGKTHPDKRPAKKDATAPSTQPKIKIGRNVSSYGVIWSSKWTLVPLKLGGYAGDLANDCQDDRAGESSLISNKFLSSTQRPNLI